MLWCVRPFSTWARVTYARRVSVSSLAGLLLATGWLLVGCGGGIGGYCEAAAECEGGNDSDIQACGLYFDETEQIAELKNCTPEFDDYFACVEESARCNDNRYGVSDGQCGDEKDRLENCIE
jgi:hypothetical protein